MIVVQGYVSHEQIAAEIERVKPMLGPEVVHLSYHIGPDTSDEPAIHVRIVITDAASARNTLGEVTARIRRLMRDEVKPYEAGLRMYIRFRKESEYAKINDPAWT